MRCDVLCRLQIFRRELHKSRLKLPSRFLIFSKSRASCVAMSRLLLLGRLGRWWLVTTFDGALGLLLGLLLGEVCDFLSWHGGWEMGWVGWMRMLVSTSDGHSPVISKRHRLRTNSYQPIFVGHALIFRVRSDDTDSDAYFKHFFVVCSPS